MTVLIALICYATAWTSLLNSVRNREPSSSLFRAALPLAIAVHAWVAFAAVFSSSGIQLGFFQVASVLFVIMNLIVALSSLRQPLSNLFIILLPLSCLALLCATFLFTRQALSEDFSYALVSHILLSIAAYSLMTIATLQALLLNYQTSQLKAHHVKSVMGIFPPLQTMESLLFDLLRAGFVLLTLSIATGVIFIEDLIAQQLSHKTLFSVVSWIIYAVLLCGRHVLGWRGRVAIRWVIAGFAMLMLAYFGSKFVLEVLIQS